MVFIGTWVAAKVLLLTIDTTLELLKDRYFSRMLHSHPDCKLLSMPSIFTPEPFDCQVMADTSILKSNVILVFVHDM